MIVRGRIVDADTGAPLAAVTVTGFGDEPPYTRRAPSDARGAFEVPMTPGRIRVALIDPTPGYAAGCFHRELELEAGAHELEDIALVHRRQDGRRGDWGFEIRGRSPAPTAEHAATVVSVAPDGPAARAGLRKGDMLVAIDGRDVTGVHHGLAPGLVERAMESLALTLSGGRSALERRRLSKATRRCRTAFDSPCPLGGAARPPNRAACELLFTRRMVRRFDALHSLAQSLLLVGFALGFAACDRGAERTERLPWPVPEGCACDVTGACDYDCLCDPACSCACDTTRSCDSDCRCDADCGCPCDQTEACNADCSCDLACPFPECACDVTAECDPGCRCDGRCHTNRGSADPVCDAPIDACWANCIAAGVSVERCRGSCPVGNAVGCYALCRMRGDTTADCHLRCGSEDATAEKACYALCEVRGEPAERCRAICGAATACGRAGCYGPCRVHEDDTASCRSLCGVDGGIVQAACYELAEEGGDDPASGRALCGTGTPCAERACFHLCRERFWPTSECIALCGVTTACGMVGCYDVCFTNGDGTATCRAGCGMAATPCHHCGGTEMTAEACSRICRANGDSPSRCDVVCR